MMFVLKSMLPPMTHSLRPFLEVFIIKISTGITQDGIYVRDMESHTMRPLEWSGRPQKSRRKKLTIWLMKQLTMMRHTKSKQKIYLNYLYIFGVVLFIGRIK